MAYQFFWWSKISNRRSRYSIELGASFVHFADGRRLVLYARKWLIFRGVGRLAASKEGRVEELLSFYRITGKVYQKGETENIVSIMIHIV